MFRSILSRLLITAAIVMAAPIGATAAPGGSGTAQIDGADQVALGAAKPADGRVVPSAGRKPDLGARLSVVLGLLPGEATALDAPTWTTLDASGPAPTAPGRSVPSCKTSRGPPLHASLAS